MLWCCSPLLHRGFNLLTMGIIAAGFSGANCVKSQPMSEDFQCLTPYSASLLHRAMCCSTAVCCCKGKSCLCWWK